MWVEAGPVQADDALGFFGSRLGVLKSYLVGSRFAHGPVVAVVSQCQHHLVGGKLRQPLPQVGTQPALRGHRTRRARGFVLVVAHQHQIIRIQRQGFVIEFVVVERHRLGNLQAQRVKAGVKLRHEALEVPLARGRNGLEVYVDALQGVRGLAIAVGVAHELEQLINQVCSRRFAREHTREHFGVPVAQFTVIVVDERHHLQSWLVRSHEVQRSGLLEWVVHPHVAPWLEVQPLGHQFIQAREVGFERRKAVVVPVHVKADGLGLNLGAGARPSARGRSHSSTLEGLSARGRGEQGRGLQARAQNRMRVHKAREVRQAQRGEFGVLEQAQGQGRRQTAHTQTDQQGRAAHPFPAAFGGIKKDRGCLGFSRTRHFRHSRADSRSTRSALYGVAVNVR